MAVEEVYYAFNPWWERKPFEAGVPRPTYTERLAKSLERRQIDIVLGSRRVGKTTILKQLVKSVLDRGAEPNRIFYLALDHPELARMSVSEHLRTFRRLFMHEREVGLTLLLDEVHESPNWEGELKAIYDLEKVKIVCSGSTASLLRSQGGKLTGRQIVTTIYPLSFEEFLAFKQVRVSSAEEYKYEQLADDYLQTGGYPENVLAPSPEYLANLLEDIIARDLIRLYQIRRADVLRDLFRLLAASVGSRTSFTKLARSLGIAVDTVREYVGYFESAFLVGLLEKWTTSHTEKVYTAKKIYLADTGLKTLLTGSGDLGAKAENAVFLHLMRTGEACGYFAKQQREVDFVCAGFEKPRPLEVKYDTVFDWESRRFGGLRLFLKEYPNTKEALVVSKSVQDSFTHNGARVTVLPLWKLLLGSPPAG